jgi:hypothetical protein
MRAELQGALILRRKLLLHELCPQSPGSAQLGNLDVEVHADTKEEAETRRHLVDAKASSNTRTNVFKTISEGEGELQARVGCKERSVRQCDMKASTSAQSEGRSVPPASCM